MAEGQRTLTFFEPWFENNVQFLVKMIEGFRYYCLIPFGNVRPPSFVVSLGVLQNLILFSRKYPFPYTFIFACLMALYV